MSKTALVVDKIGWIRHFEDILILTKSIDLVIIQKIDYTKKIEHEFLKILKKNKINFVVPFEVNNNNLRKSPFLYKILFLIDLLRYQNNYYKDYKFIKNRAIHWNKANIFYKVSIMIFLKIISLINSKKLVVFINNLLLNLAEKIAGNITNNIFHLINDYEIKKVILVPYCHAAVLNYDQQVLVAKLRNTEIKTIGLPGSWDNLTNKGSIKIKPDYLFVWNEYQKKEAIELNHYPKNRIFIIGPIGYEKWYKYLSINEKFNNPLNLTYLCSSDGIATNEEYFINEIINTFISNYIGPVNIIIRTHPKSQLDKNKIFLKHKYSISNGEYADTRPTDKKNISNILKNTDILLGINTSLFVEAACFNKIPVTVDQFIYKNRHPHENIIFEEFGIKYKNFQEFALSIKKKLLFKKIKDKKRINIFLKKFYDIENIPSPSKKFFTLINKLND